MMLHETIKRSHLKIVYLLINFDARRKIERRASKTVAFIESWQRFISERPWSSEMWDNCLNRQTTISSIPRHASLPEQFKGEDKFYGVDTHRRRRLIHSSFIAQLISINYLFGVIIFQCHGKTINQSGSERRRWNHRRLVFPEMIVLLMNILSRKRLMMIAVTRIEKISSRSEAERKLDYQNWNSTVAFNDESESSIAAVAPIHSVSFEIGSYKDKRDDRRASIGTFREERRLTRSNKLLNHRAIHFRFFMLP